MTATELVGLWRVRDQRYAMRRPLSESEIDSVKAWRRSEVDDLPAPERTVPWNLLIRWTPPLVVR